MNFGEFLHLHPENIKKLIRKIENLENKLANARVAIVFNKTCLNIYIIFVYAGSKFSLIQVLLKTGES